jgi:hypothetical protein
VDETVTQRIRERAYQLWVSSGYCNGQADQHWLIAEREVFQELCSAESKAAPKKKTARSPVTAPKRKSSKAEQATAH